MASRNLHADELLLEQKEFQGSMINQKAGEQHIEGTYEMVNMRVTKRVDMDSIGVRYR